MKAFAGRYQKARKKARGVLLNGFRRSQARIAGERRGFYARLARRRVGDGAFLWRGMRARRSSAAARASMVRRW